MRLRPLSRPLYTFSLVYLYLLQKGPPSRSGYGPSCLFPCSMLSFSITALTTHSRVCLCSHEFLDLCLLSRCLLCVLQYPHTFKPLHLLMQGPRVLLYVPISLIRFQLKMVTHELLNCVLNWHYKATILIGPVS